MRLLTVAEVADRLAVSERRVRQLVADRALPHLRIGRSIRVSEDSLAEWVASLTAAHTPPALRVVHPVQAHPDAHALEEVARRHRLG